MGTAAYEKPVLNESYQAVGDLSALQYHFASASGADGVAGSGAGADGPGIIQNKSADAATDTNGDYDKTSSVMVIGISRLVLAGTVARDDILMSDANSEALVATSTNVARAKALKAGVAGDIIPALVLNEGRVLA